MFSDSKMYAEVGYESFLSIPFVQIIKKYKKLQKIPTPWGIYLTNKKMRITMENNKKLRRSRLDLFFQQKLH